MRWWRQPDWRDCALIVKDPSSARLAMAAAAGEVDALDAASGSEAVAKAASEPAVVQAFHRVGEDEAYAPWAAASVEAFDSGVRVLMDHGLPEGTAVRRAAMVFGTTQLDEEFIRTAAQPSIPDDAVRDAADLALARELAAYIAEPVAKDWDEDEHPRHDDGRFRNKAVAAERVLSVDDGAARAAARQKRAAYQQFRNRRARRLAGARHVRDVRAARAQARSSTAASARASADLTRRADASGSRAESNTSKPKDAAALARAERVRRINRFAAANKAQMRRMTTALAASPVPEGMDPADQRVIGWLKSSLQPMQVVLPLEEQMIDMLAKQSTKGDESWFVLDPEFTPDGGYDGDVSESAARMLLDMQFNGFKPASSMEPTQWTDEESGLPWQRSSWISPVSSAFNGTNARLELDHPDPSLDQGWSSDIVATMWFSPEEDPKTESARFTQESIEALLSAQDMTGPQVMSLSGTGDITDPFVLEHVGPEEDPNASSLPPGRPWRLYPREGIELAKADADWDESEHPRDDLGRFANKLGTSVRSAGGGAYAYAEAQEQAYAEEQAAPQRQKQASLADIAAAEKARRKEKRQKYQKQYEKRAKRLAGARRVREVKAQRAAAARAEAARAAQAEQAAAEQARRGESKDMRADEAKQRRAQRLKRINRFAAHNRLDRGIEAVEASGGDSAPLEQLQAMVDAFYRDVESFEKMELDREAEKAGAMFQYTFNNGVLAKQGHDTRLAQVQMQSLYRRYGEGSTLEDTPLSVDWESDGVITFHRSESVGRHPAIITRAFANFGGDDTLLEGYEEGGNSIDMEDRLSTANGGELLRAWYLSHIGDRQQRLNREARDIGKEAANLHNLLGVQMQSSQADPAKVAAFREAQSELTRVANQVAAADRKIAKDAGIAGSKIGEMVATHSNVIDMLNGTTTQVGGGTAIWTPVKPIKVVSNGKLIDSALGAGTVEVVAVAPQYNDLTNMLENFAYGEGGIVMTDDQMQPTAYRVDMPVLLHNVDSGKVALHATPLDITGIETGMGRKDRLLVELPVQEVDDVTAFLAPKGTGFGRRG